MIGVFVFGVPAIPRQSGAVTFSDFESFLVAKKTGPVDTLFFFVRLVPLWKLTSSQILNLLILLMAEIPNYPPWDVWKPKKIMGKPTTCPSTGELIPDFRVPSTSRLIGLSFSNRFIHGLNPNDFTNSHG